MSISKSAMIQVLGSPVAYYATFAKVAKDVCAGVFISQFFYWYGRGHDPELWIYKTQAEIEAETGLTRRNQETARKNLKALGILEEKLEGLPAKLHYRLNLDRLFELVDNLVCANPPNCDGGTRQTVMAEPANHSIYTETTTKTTTESASHPTPAHRATEKKPNREDPFFELMCRITGIDWKTTSAERRGQLNQARRILSDAGYTTEDLTKFWNEVWLKDWRYKKNRSRPTIQQLRDEIGKVKATNDKLPTADNDTTTDYDSQIFADAAELAARLNV
jgi:hypothetical protein